jgi:hypothetical protein
VNAQTLGATGEKFVLDLLQQAGLDARPTTGADILVQSSGLRVEVKSARLSSRHGRTGQQRYQFCLRKAGKTDVRNSDLLVLLCYNGRPEPAIYAIPTERLGDRSKIALPENLRAYAGRWQWYQGFDRALNELGV